ncbi:DUF6582 domain-containing protein [Mycobacterium europaeum]|uniref:DUF6582 domain-containing protein n=1 Tax=Mycobacterium europaeum TaxID=761804 RepID=UPI000B82245A|nr:DUF6582 domain-containing protein [Mycobacterium europaeum]
MTVKDRELMKVGNWKVRSGHDFEVTPELIKAAVAAHQSGVLRKPTIRLGHGDERFSGDPAMGFVDNLRISDDGETLYGDLLGVPKGFAKIMPSAYPSLSIEGMYDYTAPDGTKHDFVLTGLALLGATAPGISDLKSVQDVADFYEADIAAAIGEIGGTAVVIEAADAPLTPAKNHADPGYLDRNGDQAKDGNGVPRYAIDNAEQVRSALGYLTKNKANEHYTPKQRAEVLAKIKAAAEKFGVKVSDTDGKTEASTASEQKGAVVALPEKLAEALGVDASADEDAIAAAWETFTANAEQAKTELEQKVAASAPPPGSVVLDPAAYQELHAKAEAGQRAEARQIAEDDERFVMAAIHQGKFPPARKQHWLDYLKTDRDGGRQHIEAMAPGLVPVQEVGHAGVAGSIAAEAGSDGPDQGIEYVHNQVMAKLGLGKKGVN